MDKGDCAQVLLPPTRSIAMAKNRLERVPCSDDLPLAHALNMASTTGMNAQKSGDVGEVLVTCISDGRTNVPLSSADGVIVPDAKPMNKGFDDNMEIICSNISARVPNHQLVVPTADSLEGAAELREGKGNVTMELAMIHLPRLRAQASVHGVACAPQWLPVFLAVLGMPPLQQSPSPRRALSHLPVMPSSPPSPPSSPAGSRAPAATPSCELGCGASTCGALYGMLRCSELESLGCDCTGCCVSLSPPPPSLPPSTPLPVQPSPPPSPPSLGRSLSEEIGTGTSSSMPCIQCTDDANSYMISEGLTCATWSWGLANRCNGFSDAAKLAGKAYCQQSCFDAGRGYVDANCCPPTDSPPPGSTCATARPFGEPEASVFSIDIALTAGGVGPSTYNKADCDGTSFTGSGSVSWLRLADVRPGSVLSLFACGYDTDLSLFKGRCDAPTMVACNGDGSTGGVISIVDGVTAVVDSSTGDYSCSVDYWSALVDLRL